MKVSLQLRGLGLGGLLFPHPYLCIHPSLIPLTLHPTPSHLHPFIPASTHPSLDPFIPSFIHSFIHSYLHGSMPPCIHPLIPSCLYMNVPPSLPSSSLLAEIRSLDKAGAFNTSWYFLTKTVPVRQQALPLLQCETSSPSFEEKSGKTFHLKDQKSRPSLQRVHHRQLTVF